MLKTASLLGAAAFAATVAFACGSDETTTGEDLGGAGEGGAPSSADPEGGAGAAGSAGDMAIAGASGTAADAAGAAGSAGAADSVEAMAGSAGVAGSAAAAAGTAGAAGSVEAMAGSAGVAGSAEAAGGSAGAAGSAEAAGGAAGAGPALTDKEELGKQIFFDENLSEPAGQACATCHDPDTGFADPDSNIPTSAGVNTDLFGNRNSPPCAYATFSPELVYDEAEDMYSGGQFWDGRASTLVEQAMGPFLNPVEMANPDEATVVQKVQDAAYADLFRTVYGADSLDNVMEAYGFIADAIAAFETSHEVNQFSSKYDAYLAGTAELTEEEQRGLALFKDEARGNCAACHPSQPGSDGSPPLFTDFTYDNLGIPRNPNNPFYSLPAQYNPEGEAFVDIGLEKTTGRPEDRGKFKVPHLRNIALTAPYFHNGLISTLVEVVAFYNTRDSGSWAPPEVADNVNTDELGDLGLTSQEMTDIVAFLNTLTDGYEP